MRRGLMKWREDELSADDIGARVGLLRSMMAERKLEAFISYTTLVRPAAVHYLTGFTPYWSDGLLLVDRGTDAPVFVTALSKRVGKWLGGVNPTCEIMHAPRPGRKIGEILARKGVRRVGALELDMIPGEHIEDLNAAARLELMEAGDLFAAVRARPSASETRLASRAEAIARRAFEELSAQATTVGDIAGPLERSVRSQGAEECYIAVAPDLAHDMRLARHHGRNPLGEIFAARISVAYNGVWTRFTRTMRRGAAYTETAATAPLRMTSDVDLSQPLADQIAASAIAARVSLTSWAVESPSGTRPLVRLAAKGYSGSIAAPYGVLSLSGRDSDGGPFLFSGLVVAGAARKDREAA